MNFDVVGEKFNTEIIESPNTFAKIRVEGSKLCELLTFLKNNAQFDFDRLNTIVAVDLKDSFQLIYDLHSVKSGLVGRISVLLDRNSPKISSVTDIFKSAYFDECEIYDMFGIDFIKNPNLKRLYMPAGWVGHPLRKDYVQDDDRLAWNK